MFGFYYFNALTALRTRIELQNHSEDVVMQIKHHFELLKNRTREQFLKTISSNLNGISIDFLIRFKFKS